MLVALCERLVRLVRGLLLFLATAALFLAALKHLGTAAWGALQQRLGADTGAAAALRDSTPDGTRTALPICLGHPGAAPSVSPTQRLKGTIRSGVITVRRFARPFLRVETELVDGAGGDNDAMMGSTTHGGVGGGDVGSTAPLTPQTAIHFTATKIRRAVANARIRRRLSSVAPSEIATSLKVNACSWNVDQRPPPEYSVAFLTWMLGKSLAQRVDHYHQQRQRIMSVSTSPVVSPSQTPLPPSQGRWPSLEQQAETARRLAESDARLNHLLSSFPDLLIITLQEVDMGGVALVKESTLSSTAWTEAILETLHLASDRQLFYRRLKVVQLVGLVLIALVQARHVDYISHVRLSLTRTGAMRVLGNKGSVAMRATIYGKRFLFITAHFAAHKYNEERRMYNYHAALNDLRFDMPAFTDDESDVLRTCVHANESTASMIDSFVKGRSAWDRLFRVFDRPGLTDTESRVLDQHDYIFFLGDLNSRLHAIDGADIRAHIERNEFDFLLIHDELRQGMVYGDIFDGFEEQWINFPPTYKFDRGTSNYDTSRKKRDPAWCDRVLFRVLDTSGNAPGPAPPPLTGPGSSCEATGSPSEQNSPRGVSHAFTAPGSPCHSMAPSANPHVPAGAEVGGPGWVTLADIANLGLEAAGVDEVVPPSHWADDPASASTSATGSSAAATPTTASAAVVASGRRTGSPRTTTASAALETTGSAASLVSSESAGGTPAQRGPPAPAHREPCPSTGSLDAWNSSPTAPYPCASFTPHHHHPLWKQRQVDETFKAARRPVDPQTLEDVRFPMVPNRINALEYFCVGDLRQSDHRPICARFEAKVIFLKPNLVRDLLADMHEAMEQDSAQGVARAPMTPPWAEAGSAQAGSAPATGEPHEEWARASPASTPDSTLSMSKKNN